MDSKNIRVLKTMMISVALCLLAMFIGSYILLPAAQPQGKIRISPDSYLPVASKEGRDLLAYWVESGEYVKSGQEVAVVLSERDGEYVPVLAPGDGFFFPATFFASREEAPDALGFLLPVHGSQVNAWLSFEGSMPKIGDQFELVVGRRTYLAFISSIFSDNTEHNRMKIGLKLTVAKERARLGLEPGQDYKVNFI